MTGNRYEVYFWGDGNILELDSGDFCIFWRYIELYTLKVIFVVYKLYLNKKKRVGLLS